MTPNDPDLTPNIPPQPETPTPPAAAPQPAAVENPPLATPLETPGTPAPATESPATLVAPKKKSKAPFIIIIAVVVLALIGVAGYYAYTTFFAPETASNTNTEEVTQTLEAETTPESIDEDVADIEKTLTEMNDEELSDETMSDATLNQ